MAKEMSELQAKLKKADPIVRDYVSELEMRNAKRQLQIVKLEAEKVELNGRIKALEKQRLNPAPDAALVGTAGDLLKLFKPKRKPR